MALHWNWSEVSGEITHKNGDTYNWYEGNGLIIALFEWEQDGESMYRLNWFFADKDHARNCLGLSKGHENLFSENPITEITIHRKHCYQWKDIVNLMVRAFPDIKIVLD